jgi:hypothetical protein
MNSTSLAAGSGVGAWYDDLLSVSTKDGDQPETILDWAKFAVDTGGEYLTNKQREEAAKAEADLIRQQRELLLAMNQDGGTMQPGTGTHGANWVPWAIGGAALVAVGVIAYFAMK